jgi:hypothetical protein
MNKNIRELAEQSGYQEGFRFALEDFDLEKFADLIIKECIDAIMNNTDRHRKEYFANLVKEHFGVE